jgi:signal transduction histidine kinase
VENYDSLAHIDLNIQADIEAIGRIDAVASILEVVCRTTGMGFAAIARVTDDRWVACAVRDEINFGLARGGELVLETTICNEIRQHHEEVVIDHVSTDDSYANHHTPLMYGFQSYISVPIILKNGSFFGTLCAIDPKPADLKNTHITGMFSMFADLIAFHLHAMEQLALSESRLIEERKTSELREHFIAILGHDLRNPVGAVSSAAQLLMRMPLDERMMRLATIIQDSSFRMKGLIENILDFARGRLGEGITVNCQTNDQLEKILSQVVSELQIIWPDRIIETDFRLKMPVICDSIRIAQLFSNLLGNALSHSEPGTPVKVKGVAEGDEFRLSVSNAGEEISAATMKRLFHPFSRGEVKPGQQGLGLGLYISSEIARAHKGSLEVSSNSGETCFTLKIPLNHL